MRMRNKKWTKSFLENNLDIHYELKNPHDNNSELDQTLIDILAKIKKISADYKYLALEIGTGKGQFINTFAQQNPDYFVIGFEKNTSIAASATRKLVEDNTKNTFMFIGDFAWIAELLIKNLFQFDKIFLNFSDPWLKTRYQKRRLVDDWFIKTYRQLLSDNGTLNFKTDNLTLFAHGILLLNNDQWTFQTLTLDLHNSDFVEKNIITEYEQKFIDRAIKINFLIAKL